MSGTNVPRYQNFVKTTQAKASEVDPVVQIFAIYGKEFAVKLGFPPHAISAIKPSVPPAIQPSKGRHASP
jgi:hypothetical protein